MTPRQMYKMMLRYGISVVFDKAANVWSAGECRGEGDSLDCLTVIVSNPVREILLHSGPTPEIAVEDYCNARNIEWDRD